MLTVIAHAQQLQFDIVHEQTDTCSVYAHFPCETGFVVVAMAAYRALETETTVRYPHRVSPSAIHAGLAGGLLVGVLS